MGCTILVVLLVMFLVAAFGFVIYDEYRVTHVYMRIRENLNNQYIVEYYGAILDIQYSTTYRWNSINGANVFASLKDAEAAAVAFRTEELKKYNKDRNKKVWYIK